MELSLDTLLELEHRGWQALCSSRGGSFYGDLMTEEALMILVNGAVMDRGTIAATLDEAPPWAEYSIDEPRRIPVGEDATALVYRARATREGQDEPFTALMASTYRVVDGVPRLALYQQTTETH
ncbi:DUF4440 domain-containing protein [Zhihengliuella sp.]|uniref:DUF4440 domain-containing protein n=1 Tax=Zhihengliuella sp. TaxID=1954483 RepID=UPI0028112986|nr:DUF4440 domain-containing protein [Zhihengliuella sp.]